MKQKSTFLQSKEAEIGLANKATFCIQVIETFLTDSLGECTKTEHYLGLFRAKVNKICSIESYTRKSSPETPEFVNNFVCKNVRTFDRSGIEVQKL